MTFSPQEAARQLSLDEFRALVDQLPDLRRAVLQGIGEPLLNRDLAPMIAHLKTRGVYSVFNTNAALLTRRRQVELIESGLDELRVSLDSSTPETYARMRGIPAFERVVDNLGEMVRTRAELGVEDAVAVDLGHRLAREPRRAARMWSTWPGGSASTRSTCSAWCSGAKAWLAANRAFTNTTIMIGREAERIIAEAERRAAQHGLRFCGADALSPRQEFLERSPEREPWRACSRPLRLAYITAQGTALPCCIAPFTDAPFESMRLGNYLRDGVASVWNGEAYRRFREQLYSSEPPPSCRNCGLAWSL